MPSPPDTRLQELHLTLPPAPKPVAKYKTAVRQGNLLYVSGHGPLKPDGTMVKGRVGGDITAEDGYAAARQTGLAILATTKATLGSNSAHLTARYDERTGWVIVLCAIDNLMKGAAGQAIQCANLMLGMDETMGLAQAAVYP